MSRRRIDDRRARPRFEIVGDLWGTLRSVAPLPLVNVSAAGALIRAARPLDVGSVHAVTVANGGPIGRAQVCVRHVTPVDEAGEAEFLIGLEFIALTPELTRQIAAWTAGAGGGVAEA